LKLLFSTLLLLSLLITSCSKSKIDIKGLVKSSGAKGDPAQVSSVAITNNQLIVNGSNLSGVIQVRVTGPSAFDQTFSV
jgi:hypothetical protein